MFRGDPNKVDENGFTRLQRAIIRNDLASVVSLIKAGADVNYRGGMIFPPLHLALDKDRQAIALALVQAGADINLQDAQGRTPLHHCASQSQDNFIQTLLKLGAEPNVRDEDGRTPLHSLSTARPSLVDILVLYKADPNARDDAGNTPLHLFLDKPQVVDRLLRNGADPNIANNRGQSAFTQMIDEEKMQKYPQILQNMISSKANVDAVNPMGETVLHLAARLEKHETFNMVLHRCDLKISDKAGNTVAHVLARAVNVTMLGRVLQAAPELLAEKNHDGLTPLGELSQWANRNLFVGGYETVEAAARIMLIHKADPNVQDRQGRTMLHFAARHGRTELAEYLLAKKADPDLRDAKGRAPLHEAIDKKNVEMIDRLLDLGADPDLTDDRGWTVLDRLAESGDRDSSVVQRLIVAGGQYQKQLPLNPELMRPKNDNNGIGKGLGAGAKVLRHPGAKPNGKFGGQKP